MPETMMDMIRSRIEAVRGKVGGTSTQRPRIIDTVKERVKTIRGNQGGIVERIGERFPSLKRVRGQLEPWERPALFERARAQIKPLGTLEETPALKIWERPALFDRTTTKKQIAGVEVTKEAERPALF